MPKYDVEITRTKYERYLVEAEDAEAARAEAWERYRRMERPHSTHTHVDVTRVEEVEDG